MNETLALLQDSLARMLREQVSPARTMAAEAVGVDAATWDQLGRLGVTGGEAAEMTLDERMAVLRALGHAGALVPYAESEVLGRWLAAAAGLDVGEEMLTVCAVDAAAVRGSPRRGLTLGLAGRRILWGRQAARILFVIAAGDRCWLAPLPADRVPLRPGVNMAGEPWDVVAADALPIAAADLRSLDDRFGPDEVRLRGALCRAVAMVGALDRCNALSLRYARDRRQFGRAIADFQVIQSYLAAMAGEFCAAAASADAAVAAAAGTGDGEAAIAAAKIRVGQAARLIAAHAHQIHGAIGFTRELPLQLWTRRLWAWRDDYGGEALWSRRLGGLVIGRGADALWADLTATPG